MPTPNYPRYVSPRERAENRARIRAFILWSATGIAAAVIVMMFAYTDQAPAWLRELAFRVDGAFGYPMLWLIKTIAT